eukprot:3507838-Rhodomonas_salina.1
MCIRDSCWPLTEHAALPPALAKSPGTASNTPTPTPTYTYANANANAATRMTRHPHTRTAQQSEAKLQEMHMSHSQHTSHPACQPPGPIRPSAPRGLLVSTARPAPPRPPSPFRQLTPQIENTSGHTPTWERSSEILEHGLGGVAVPHGGDVAIEAAARGQRQPERPGALARQLLPSCSQWRRRTRVTH